MLRYVGFYESVCLYDCIWTLESLRDFKEFCCLPKVILLVSQFSLLLFTQPIGIMDSL